MQNLELKCRYPDLDRAAHLALGLGATLHGRLSQTDTYFRISPGRLKLRHIRSDAAECYELIHYHRPDCLTAKASNYERLPVADGPGTLAFFTAALGVLVRVDKERIVYLMDHLRIHLDEVSGLGRFLEFELAVTTEQPLEACRRRMEELIRVFGVARKDLIRGSYSDLLPSV